MSYPGGHAGFLAIALATHALVGFAVGRLLFDRPAIGAVGGLAPDIDFLFPAALEWPFVHRGVTHTLLVLVVAAAVVGYRDRGRARALAVGYLSHLLLDVTTPKGVPLAYPVVERSFHLDLGTTAHSPLPTAALWVCCLLLLAYRDDAVPIPVPERG